MKKNKFRYRWIIAPVLALACFAFTQFAGANNSIIENWYSQLLYPHLAGILSAISSLFSFSLDDVFYMALVLTAPTLIALLIFRKISFAFAGKFILNLLTTVYILFYVFWGLNYFREDVNTRLQLEVSSTNKYEFLEVMNRLIDETNNNYLEIEEINKAEIDSLIEISYSKLAKTLRLSYPAGSRTDKKITFSKLFAQSGITGYYGPFFNEVHVNKHVLALEYPVILAHEKAHQFGITGESEANFYAWLVCAQSQSQVLRYSGNLLLLRYFFSQATRLEEYPQLVRKLDPRVQKDFDRIRAHWQKLRKVKYEKVASKVNDAYLKTNQIEEGIDDYYGVVKHVMDFLLDDDFQQKNKIGNPL